MERRELAEKLELIGGIFEIDGMKELLDKFVPGMSSVKFSAIVIQIESLLMKGNQAVADRLIAANQGIAVEEVEKMEDAEYTNSLKTAIITDVLGFFASSPRTDGKK